VQARSKFLIVALASAAALSSARAGDVKQLGATPGQDQLIQSLTPPGQGASQDIQGRGLRVLSGKGPQTGNAGEAHDTRASAVALDVRFATGSADLTDAARDTVDRIGKALNSQQLSSYKFRIEGHTDSTGRADRNLVLSQKRAEAVKAYLVSSEGIQADRLQTEGKGSSEPLDPDHPASGVNRRVQIVNLGQ
jgi:outer membrane protein OmpA-like peptidoglycan-associated protein